MDNLTVGSIIRSYIYTEQILEEVTKIIPYCEEHDEVWSPRLATCIMEACSQLDSLWKFAAHNSSNPGAANLDITDHFNNFRDDVSKQWLVFLGENPEIIIPFEKWIDKEKYERLDWWQAYTSLKHDRWRNIKMATFNNAVNSVAGLFLAILKSKHCRNAVEESNWLSSAQFWAGSKLHIDEKNLDIKKLCFAAESNLYSHPYEWGIEEIKKTDVWEGEASARFIGWFDAFEGKQ